VPRVLRYGGVDARQMTLRILAPAKVNLHLEVGPRDSDGYHPVETVLHALEFGDFVTIVPAESFVFSCAPDLGVPHEDNLALRAARAMSVRFSRHLGMSISLEKRIPAGAGLGGGSADAAAVIFGLSRIWGIQAGDVGLGEVARSLGADVPFFLEGGAALFTGRGDVLKARLRPLRAPIVIVKPGDLVPTAAAYAAFDLEGPRDPWPIQPLLESLEAGSIDGVARHLHNEMTPASSGLVPTIAEVLRFVAASEGVLGAAMAGSGSAVFGICRDVASARACANGAATLGYWATATRTRVDGVGITAV